MIQDIKSWLYRGSKQFRPMLRKNSVIDTILRLKTHRILKINRPYNLPLNKSGILKGEIIFTKFYEDCINVDAIMKFSDGNQNFEQAFNCHQIEEFHENI